MKTMIDILLAVCLTAVIYFMWVKIQKKTRISALNPLMMTIICVIITILLFHYPLAQYKRGSQVISMFLGPATMALGLNVYRNIDLLKKNFLSILAGCIVGAVVSMSSVFLLGKLLHLDYALIMSMIPKSVTTPIAMDVSTKLGGVTSVTVASVIITGIVGNVLNPFFMKLMKSEDVVVNGIAMGASAHALGTSKSNERSQEEGAMSSIALVLSGILTVLFVLILNL